jgi:mannitol-specific phosphotransferase system IIBC component
VNFVLGVFVGAAVGVLASALLLKISATRELEDLERENHTYVVALRYVRSVLANQEKLPSLDRYLRRVLGDEAGA